jgi:hypothetical protein
MLYHGHGCTSATLKDLNDILTAIDKKQYCATVFTDLAKAFDSVNHHILVNRLYSIMLYLFIYLLLTNINKQKRNIHMQTSIQKNYLHCQES